MNPADIPAEPDAGIDFAVKADGTAIPAHPPYAPGQEPEGHWRKEADAMAGPPDGTAASADSKLPPRIDETPDETF